jgi:hypothetical protein
MASTDEGREIDGSDEQSESAASAKLEIRQPGSKITDETERQPSKHPTGMISIPAIANTSKQERLPRNPSETNLKP